ncbi:MAG: prefoldin subunit alpha [Candidatus Bathyarchaeota archaeon]|nr:MAG: prefoldin subunit alpha [Candidatus Bathyarchaeota archaeon]
MSSEEETFRRLAVELRILEGTAEALQSRINLVNAALTELRVTNMTLEGLGKEKKDASLFVPIGGGSYIKARLESADKMIVGIGANVAVEKTIKVAKENMSKRTADLEKTRTSLQQQITQVIGRIQNNRSQLQELSAKLNKKERAKGVRKTKNTS